MEYKNKIKNKVLGNENTSNALMSNNIMTNETLVLAELFGNATMCLFTVDDAPGGP